MTKKGEFFKKLYIIHSEDFSDKQMDKFVMCGNYNWDYYFNEVLDKNSKNQVEEVNNVKLVEFNSQKELNIYLKELQKRKVLDMSIEPDFIGLLELA